MNIGTSVVCIDDKFDIKQMSLIPNRPVLNEVYIVRDTLLTRNGKAIHLEEITNPPLHDQFHDGSFEPSFHIRRFRLAKPEEIKQQEEYELSTLAI